MANMIVGGKLEKVCNEVVCMKKYIKPKCNIA